MTVTIAKQDGQTVEPTMSKSPHRGHDGSNGSRRVVDGHLPVSRSSDIEPSEDAFLVAAAVLFELLDRESEHRPHGLLEPLRRD